MPCPEKRITLYYTETEWKILESVAQAEDGMDFRSMLYRRVTRLGRLVDMDEPASPTPEKKFKDYIIPSDISCQLMQLSSALNVPLATVVARFIITPMLNGHYDREGMRPAILR